MPRFPVAFNRRKSTADNLDNAAVAGPSFRVLDRSEVASGSKNFDAASGARRTVKSQSMPNTLMAVEPEDDNIFANISINRGSGSSNTTKTASDNSSRHSNVSTAPSSADLNTQQQHQQFQQQFHQQQQQQHQQEDYRLQKKQLYSDVPVPPIPKSSTTGSFFKSAGRTFSFGSQKKHVPMVSDERAPQTPPNGSTTGRDRSTTASTVTTATPPRLEDEVALDLGGDFSRMLGGGFDKRTSIMTVRDEGASRPALASRTSSGNRLNNSTLAQVDDAAKFEHSPYPESRQNSNERLLNSNALLSTSTDENFPPTVPRHGSPSDRPQTSSGGTPSVPQHSVGSIPTSLTDSNLKRSTARFGRRRSTIDNAAEDVEDEDAALLKDSLLTAQRFLAGSEPANSARSSLPSSRFGRDGLAVGYSQLPTESTSPAPGNKAVTADENMFDINLDQPSRVGQRFVAHKPTPSQNKVMTPAQFERYRKDKEREDGSRYSRMIQPDEKGSDEDEDNYEDEEDEVEKSRQAAKQRRKQLAHMTIYRQQMMKVTGEAASGPPARSSMHFSMSTPNLPVLGTLPQIESEAGPEDDDEEVPLAILAAHGFPNRNRPPTRLSTMMSNPSLHAAANPSYQRPQSVIGGDATAAASNVRLPVFARNLPQDPYGLINSNKRETFNLAGGAPAPMQQANGGGLAPGGLVGVIASEERSRAMRRGSPNMEAANRPLSNLMGQQFDPAAGIPSQMMYPGMDMHGQGQNQMAQQLQQFMQMQMQFMQMMASGGGNSMQRPMGGPMNMGMAGGRNNDMARHSFMDNGSVMDMQLPRPDAHMRTMSMVQPSSASWLPQPHMSAYAPSIRIQGANGYASSLAPSERSNVGLPGRYRPVSQAPAGPAASDLRKSMAVSGTLGSGVGNSQTSATTTPRPNTSGSASPNGSHANTRGPSPAGWDLSREQKSSSPLHNVTNAADDDDDEEGWAAMKTKRDKKRSLWKSKKSLSSDFGALFS